ncbi:hypothetical protein [Sulfuricurvum sp.]|uniref:hypothetical protein n=1 Tax=Sulfuricurvum sp. TaxID=2025608 RepID=UPI002D3D9881|nr:hypothetical protein [Sulfuricurvum sp.]HZF70882.1 hypothetical protein [Sulfuricurvum sp.]
MKNLKIAAVSTFVMIALSGCVDKAPTTGDFMRMHAAEKKEVALDQKEMAKDWDKGSALKESGVKLVKHGEDLVKSGDKDMMTGQNEIEQGNKDIEEGTRLMAASKQEFKETYPNQKLDLNK